MQVQGLTDHALQGSSSYRSAQAAADGAKFKDLLKTAEQQLKTSGTEASAVQDKKLKEACTGFEAMFMNLMYSKMRDTVPEDSLFGNSNSDKILQSMLDTEQMNQAAKSGGLGLAEMLYQQLSRQQSAMNTQTAAKK